MPQTKLTFDEAFINAFQFSQQMNQKRQEQVQDIKFKMRELSLLDDYRNKALGQDQEQFQAKQEFDTQKLTEDIRQFEVGNKYKYDALNQDKEQFGMKLKFDEDKFTFDKEKFGKGLALDWANLNWDKTKFSIARSDAQTGYKEKELSQKGIESLNYLKNPKETSGGILGIGSDYSEAKQNIDNAISGLAAELMSSDAQNYFLNLKGDKWKNPLELSKKISEDIRSGKISDKTASELSTMMNYYEQFYSGIKDAQ